MGSFRNLSNSYKKAEAHASAVQEYRTDFTDSHKRKFALDIPDIPVPGWRVGSTWCLLRRPGGMTTHGLWSWNQPL